MSGSRPAPAPRLPLKAEFAITPGGGAVEATVVITGERDDVAAAVAMILRGVHEVTDTPCA